MYTRRVLPQSAPKIRRQLESIKDRVHTEGPLAEGQHGQSVKALEAHLAAAGLFKGKADAKFDAATKRAVQALQKHERLDPTGEVDWKTWQAVRGIDLFVKKGFKTRGEEGQRGADIAQAERKLRKLGFDGPKADGLYTRRTTVAVKRFQRAYGLKASGDITAGTSAMLNQLTQQKRALGYVNGVPRRITLTSVGDGEYLRSDAARSFLKMKAAAARAGVQLSATSGFRSMAEQRYLYDLYLQGRGNLAARPGYSNHQGGISMDVGGVGSYSTRAYSWLAHNAKKYGFVNDVGGEYWHWTYKR